jgi:hypothetical protein
MLVREEGNLEPLGEETVSLKSVFTDPVFIYPSSLSSSLSGRTLPSWTSVSPFAQRQQTGLAP